MAQIVRLQSGMAAARHAFAIAVRRAFAPDSANRRASGSRSSRGGSVASIASARVGGSSIHELLARLVDVSAVEGDSLDEIRKAVKEQVSTALDEAPELLGEPIPVGARSPGVQDRRRHETPKDPNAWLRKAARRR